MLQRIVDTVVNGLDATDQAKLELTGRNFSIRYVCHYCAKFKGPKEKRRSRSKNKESGFELSHNFLSKCFQQREHASVLRCPLSELINILFNECCMDLGDFLPLP